MVSMPVFGGSPTPAGRTRWTILGCSRSTHNGRRGVRNEDALKIHRRALGQIIVFHSQTRLLVVGCDRANDRGAACRTTLAQGH